MDNTDLHHIRPSDCNINIARSNRYFGACGIAAPSSECTSPAHIEAPADTSRDTETFLPPADRRGDIARAILYMDLRYDSDESTTEDLVVSDCPEDDVNGHSMGYLSQLLQWHMDDPPDEAERERNNKACESWQGNRNPFIDHPDLASIYHGGVRPLVGDGLGYDCSGPRPAAGTCSDESGFCTSASHCLCSSSTASRNLQDKSTSSSNLRKLQTSKLIISGIIDGPLSGGYPKAIELYALDDIPDLSAYGVGSANNGGGTDGQEFTFPSGSFVTAGSFITISKETDKFTSYFGEAPNYVSGALYINGDDAMELFFNGGVADTFGDINVDGSGQDWEYMDGWAYRLDGEGPDSTTFCQSEWTFSGKNAVDGCADNDSCGSSFPFKSYVGGSVATPPPTPNPTDSPCQCLL